MWFFSLIAALIAVEYLFDGYRIIRFVAFVQGFLACFLLSLGVVSMESFLLALIIACIGGTICAKYLPLGIFFLGAGLGMSLMLNLLPDIFMLGRTYFEISPLILLRWYHPIVICLVMASVGFLAIGFRKPMIILSTAWLGACTILGELMRFCTSFNWTPTRQYAVLITLFLTGGLFQYFSSRSKGKAPNQDPDATQQELPNLDSGAFTQETQEKDPGVMQEDHAKDPPTNTD